MFEVSRIALASPRLLTAIRLYVAASLVIWISKISALYGHHAVWSEHKFPYVAAVGVVSSWREILLVLALSALFYFAGRALAERRTVLRLVEALILLTLSLVGLLNYVSAELLAKLGSPLTLPLIHYSDIFTSEHGRSAIIAWVGNEFLLLGVGMLITLVLSDALLRRLLKSLPKAPLLTLLALGTTTIVVVGIARSPAPASHSESATAALLASLRYLDPPDANANVAAPFRLGGLEAGLPRPMKDGAPRNVILIVLEGAAAQYLDLYGGDFRVTPRLAARASQSVVVERAYAQSVSSTVALRTMLSSRYPYVSPTEPPDGLQLHNRQMLPELLRDAGLRTAFFHSSDTGFGGVDDLLAQAGFETIRGHGDRRCPGRTLEDRYSSLGNLDRCTFVDLVQWIEERPSEPFFAVLWTFQSHYPYFAEIPRARRLDPAVVPAKRVREEQQRYFDALAEADALIDALLRRLEHAGRLEKTLVIVTADHGQAFGHRGTYGNGTSVHEESVRIPLILINSGLRAGSFGRMSGQIDVAPTILDVLGLRPPDAWDGASLFAAVPERPIYFVNTTADLVLGYRARNHKAITNLVRGTTEIYDLSSDPTERHDLSYALGDARIRQEQVWLALWASRVNQNWKSRAGQQRRRRLSAPQARRHRDPEDARRDIGR